MKSIFLLTLAFSSLSAMIFSLNKTASFDSLTSQTFTNIGDDSLELVPLAQRSPAIMIKTKERSVPLKMTKLSIETKIIGNIAITKMDMLFYNDSNQVLSGQLYFPLNEGQTVSQFALEVNGKLRDGVVVEKEKGRVAYETMVRRGIDPGLVELTKGNNFKTSIYPIPAKGHKRVVVSYQQELIHSKSNAYYQLPLFFNEVVDEFDLALTVMNEEIPQIQDKGLDNLKFSKWESAFLASYKKKKFKAQQELVVRIPKVSKANNTIVGNHPKGGKYLYSDIAFSPKTKERKQAESVCVVWDVSRSAKTRNIEKEMQFLEAYFKAHPDVKIRLLTFSNEVHENSSFSNLEELITHLKSLKFDGGTRLSCVEYNRIREDEILVFSDLIHTFGNSVLKTSDKSVQVINTAKGADYVVQNYLAGTSGGNKVDLTTMTLDEAISSIQSMPFQYLGYEILEGEISEIYPKSKQQVHRSFSFSAIMKSNSAKLKLNFGFNNSITHSEILDLSASQSYEDDLLAARLWAEKKINQLMVDYDHNKKEITHLGKTFSIVTKNTSLIVLDRVEDYVEHEIVPPLELMTEYSKLIESKQSAKKKDLADKMETVRTNWQKRVDWWNQEIKYDTVKKKESNLGYTYQWGEDSVMVLEDGASHDEMPNMNNGTYTINAMDVNASVAYTDGGDDVAGFMNVTPGVISNTSSGTGSGWGSGSGIGENNQYGRAKASVDLKRWQPKSKEYEILSKESAVNVYQKYLELLDSMDGQASFYFDAAMVLADKGRKDEAVRVLSNLSELEHENHEFLKVMANTLMQWEKYPLAITVFEEILQQRGEEPQSYRDLGLAHLKNKNYPKALHYLYEVVRRDWDDRFPEIENIVLGEINAIIKHHGEDLDYSYVDKDLLDHLPTDIRVVIDWDTDNVDIDLWVTDPIGEKCFYSNADTKIGGHMSKDFTRGYGPEEFLIKKAIKGKYKIEVNYYGNSRQNTQVPPTIQARLITNYGSSNQKEKLMTLRLKESKDVIFIGEMEIK